MFNIIFQLEMYERKLVDKMTHRCQSVPLLLPNCRSPFPARWHTIIYENLPTYQKV